jgi:hypothetical protein
LSVGPHRWKQNRSKACSSINAHERRRRRRQASGREVSSPETTTSPGQEVIASERDGPGGVSWGYGLNPAAATRRNIAMTPKVFITLRIISRHPWLRPVLRPGGERERGERGGHVEQMLPVPHRPTSFSCPQKCRPPVGTRRIRPRTSSGVLRYPDVGKTPGEATPPQIKGPSYERRTPAPLRCPLGGQAHVREHPSPSARAYSPSGGGRRRRHDPRTRSSPGGGR